VLRKFALSAATTVVLTTSMITAAHAKSCWFQGFNPFSKDISEKIKGHGYAIKQSNACNRAKRECLRKLRKAWKKGKAQQYACIRIG
jgi:hypothetical protein